MTVKVNTSNLLVDGKRVGDVVAFQLTYSTIDDAQEQQASIQYTIDGRTYLLTCPLDVISFEMEV